MAGNEIRHRDRGDMNAPERSGPVVERAIARVGWWLPEAAAAGLLAGAALWIGWDWAVWPIGIGLVIRIGWEWAPARRSARFITTVAVWIADRVRRWRHRRQARTNPAAAGTDTDTTNRNEVAS